MNVELTQAERQGILDGLASPDGEVRRLSVEQLARLGTEDAVPHLARHLGDEVWRVRKSAVEGLVRCVDHPPVQDLLVSSLADGEDPGRRNSAFEALVACGSRVTRRLVDEISNPDVDVRKLVIDALAAIGDREARQPLVGVLSDPDTNIRAAAVEALGMVGGSEEFGALLAAATTPGEDLLVRLASLRALVRLEAHVPVALLEGALDESALRPAALNLLGMSEDPGAIDVMIKALSASSRTAREAAIGGLLRQLGGVDAAEAANLVERVRAAAASNAQLVESGCERLDSANLATRLGLVQFLGLLDDPRAVMPILLTARDEGIQELALSTLVALGSVATVAIDANWERLEADSKRRACGVLGRTGGVAAERRLVESLDAADPALRCAAAEALGQGDLLDSLPHLVRRLETAATCEAFDAEEETATLMTAIVCMAEHADAVEAGLDGRLIEALTSRLSGAHEAVRLVIAQVLARLGRPQDEDCIRYLLKDESPAVRRAAVMALVRFDFSRTRDLLRLAEGDESESVRTAAAIALGEVDDFAAVEDLERMTHDEDARVVAAAFRSVGNLFRCAGTDSERGYTLLTRGLGGVAIVALASLEAVTAIGGEGAADLAASMLERPEPEVLRAAIECIDGHGVESHLMKLLGLVPHEDWSVRAEVARVFARRKHRKAMPALLRRLELEDDPFVREAVLGAIRELEE